MIKDPPANAGDKRDGGLIPGSGRSPRAGRNNSLQCPCLENPMDRGAWGATVHRVAESHPSLSDEPQHRKEIRKEMMKEVFFPEFPPSDWSMVLGPLCSTHL